MAFLPIFLLFNLLLATSQARHVPVSTENTKNPSTGLSNQKDVSVSLPGININIPTVGGGSSSSYSGTGGDGTLGSSSPFTGTGGDGALGGSSPFTGTNGDGTLGGLSPFTGTGGTGADDNNGEGGIGGTGADDNNGEGGIGGEGGDNSGDGSIGGVGGDNSSGQGSIGNAGGLGNSPALGVPRRTYFPGGDDNILPNPGFEIPNPLGGAFPIPSNP